MRDTIKAVFFDIGSTLVMGPDNAPHREIERIIGNPCIKARDISQIIMLEDFTDSRSVFERIKGAFNGGLPTHCEGKINDLWQRQESDALEIDGATEVVLALKRRGYRIGLISNIWSPYYRAFEKACPQITSALDSATLSFRDGIRKPDKTMYERALASISLRPHEAVMIGDTYTNDIAPAIELGMGTVWLLSRLEHERDSLVNVINGKLAKPDLTIGHIKALKDWVLGIGR
ncbi:MAG: HAD family hydrolase [Nitrospirae bacterium]|nr:HAD family hydrolase [Nitrospirota bacterium]